MQKAPYLPPEFLARVACELSEKEIPDFIAASSRPLKKSIRVNTLKISVADFVKLAKKKNWELHAIPWCSEGFWIDRDLNEQKTVPLGNTGLHALGLFYIQEASSMLPVEALFQDESALKIILDVAAAPGSKTTQMAAKLQNESLLVANEFSSSRLKGLFSNIERLGIRNTALTHLNGEHFGHLLPENFDAILLDAPCTGEGTIRKDYDALKNWSEQRISYAASLQKRLIGSAFEALKPGGILVYSTCTLAREENEEICLYLQDRYGSAVEFSRLENLFPNARNAITPEGFLRIWPHLFDTEGFFVAKIRKTESTLLVKSGSKNERQSSERKRNFPFTPISRENFQRMEKYYREHFGFDLNPFQKQLWQREREIWFFPQEISPLLEKIRFDRIGSKLCSIHRDEIKTEHEMIMSFGQKFPHSRKEISVTEVERYMAGFDLPLDPQFSLGDEILLTFENIPLGLGRVQRSSIKNAFPRDIVNGKVNFS